MCPDRGLRGLLCNAVEATTTFAGSVGGFIAGGGGGALAAVVTGGAAVPAVPVLAYAGAIGGASLGLAAGKAISNVLFSEGNRAEGASGGDPQLRRLSKGEIERLKKGEVNIHDLKGGRRASQYDLFTTRDGEIIVKPKSGRGPGEPTGLNINDY